MALPRPTSPISATILVLDDEPDFVTLTTGYLAKQNFEALGAMTLREANAFLGAQFIDLLLIDERLDADGASGTAFLAEVQKRQPGLSAIVISADADLRLARRAMRAGAVDIIAKPALEAEVLEAVSRALAGTELHRKARRDRWFAEQSKRPPEIVGQSEAVRSILRTVNHVADSKATVLIQGESGTGKELIARALHAASPRRGKEMIAVNMAAIAPGVVEAELFGATKGSYTDSVKDRLGYFLEADKSTLFLDEIGDAPLNVQAKLLRVLEEGVVTRVGESRPRTVDVRVVAATNQDLQKKINEKLFREDLFFRLNVVPLRTVPLRERPEDIEPIALSVLSKAQTHGRAAKGFTPEALEKLRRYSWPGNARELRNVVELAVLLGENAQLEPRDLQLGAGDPAAMEWVEMLEMQLEPAVEAFERRYFQRLKVRSGGKKTKAGVVAGCDRKTIYRYIEKLGLEFGDDDER